MKKIALVICLLFFFLFSFSQDSIYQWKVSSKKIAEGQFELSFSTQGNAQWQLYAPNQNLSEVPTTELQFADSSIRLTENFKESGTAKKWAEYFIQH